MVTIPALPRAIRGLVAIGVLLLIAGLAVYMFGQIVQKSADLLGLQQTTTTANCTDSDGGDIQTEFGSCIDTSRVKHSDACVLAGLKEELKLQEWFCMNNSCTSEIKACSPGFTCAGGKCVRA